MQARQHLPHLTQFDRLTTDLRKRFTGMGKEKIG
jgi:hypothetical protein